MIKLTQLFLSFIFIGASVGIQAQPSALPLTPEELTRLHKVKAWDIQFTYAYSEQRDGGGNLTGMGYGYLSAYPVGNWSYTYDHDLRFTLTFTVAGKLYQSDCALGSDSCLVKYQYPASVSGVVENYTRADQVELTDYCLQPDSSSFGPGMQMNQYSFSASGSKVLDGTTIGASLRGRFTIDYSINPPIVTADFSTFTIPGEFQQNRSGCGGNDSYTETLPFTQHYNVVALPYDSTNTTTGDTQVRIEGGKFVIHGSSRDMNTFSAYTPFILPRDSNTQYNGSYMTTREWVIREHPDSTITLTKPVAGDLFIAGESNKIEWIGGSDIDSLKITAILNWNTVFPTEFVVSESVPADAEEYVWNIPDTLLSYKTKIRIEDKNDPSNFAESESFRLKGYVLTRVKIIDSTYEAFASNFHGWNYLNGTLWHATWWSQFNYSTALDPYTNDPYPNFFHSIAASTFIDWPLWVEVFSEDNCYWSTILINIYKGKAEQKWKSSCGVHRGSCFGFAASSFLAFNFRNQFFTKHPQIQNVGNIFGLPLDSIIQKTINGYWAFQFGKQSLDNDVIGQPKDPRATLIEIMNMFIGDSVDIRTITIYNNGGGGGGAHTMAPIRISKDNTGPSRYRLHLYDSNNPAVDSFYILIDSLNNTWTDFTGLGPTWTGNSHFYLEIPVSNYLNTPTIGKKLSKSPDDVKGTGYVEFYNTEKANIIFTSPNGQRIGLTNGAVTNEIQDGIAIFNKNGKPSDPIGYYVPDDDYSVVLSNIIDTSETFYLTALKENLTYDYTRDNVNSSQTDRLRIGDGFSVMSTDLEEKEFNLKLISDLNSGERIFSIANTQIRQNDSLFIDELNQSELVLKNYGTEKSYNLELDERSPQSQKVFKHVSLTLQDNSSQTLLPDWDNLNQSFLKILIDLGNDGTIDDSLEIVNQATGIGDDQGSLLSPNIYNLAQNYPNPFNPSTRIQYQVSSSSQVSLKVYDVLGNEVATLVDEYKPAGSYVVEFSAIGGSASGRDPSKLSSGVYIYKIQAGEYVKAKKMILLR